MGTPFKENQRHPPQTWAGRVQRRFGRPPLQRDFRSRAHCTLATALILLGASLQAAPPEPQLSRLLPSLGLPDPYARDEAAQALGRLGAPALPALVQILEGTESEARHSAIIALIRMGAEAAPAQRALIKCLADLDKDVRFLAATALGRLGELAAEAIPRLTEALHDRDAEVRQAARAALGRIAPGPRSMAGSLPLLRSTVERLAPLLLAEHRVPGLAIAVIQDGRLAWCQGFGLRDIDGREPVDADTVFEAASMSKPIFGLLALQLVEDGRLDLDQPLSAPGPETRELPQAEVGRITARMALSHTTGMPNWRPGGEERGGPIPLDFPPGSRFGYSGEGIFYLQRRLETRLGEPLDRWAQARLFTPLGLRRTAFAWRPDLEANRATGHDGKGSPLPRSRYAHPNAAYTLYSSARDYAGLLMEALLAFQGRSGLLSPMSLRACATPQVRVAERDPIERPGSAQGQEVHWGLGWSINRTAQGDLLHHGGSNRTGFRCFSQFSPSRRTGIVIFTNGSGGGEVWTRLIAAIGDF